jgi:long-chain acyl-CoA synthetase
MTSAPDPAKPLPAHISRVDEIAAHWARVSPNRPALVEHAGAWSYGELNASVLAGRNWLVEAGARPGDRVMVVGDNCRVLVALFLAIVRLNAWPLVVNARLSDHEIDQIREHSGARLIIFTISMSPKAKVHAERYETVSANPLNAGMIAITPANSAVEPAMIELDPRQQVAALVYTSGTTGRSKGVMLTHANLLFVARTAGAMRGLCSDDRFYAVLPISHILGLSGVMLSTLYYGGTLYLTPRFDPAAILQALEAEHISVVLGTPSMYALLGEYLRGRRLATVPHPALRLLAVAGAPLDPVIKSEIESIFGQPLHNGYGITECSPTISLIPSGERRGDLSVGRLLPGLEARLVGLDGIATVRASDVGELLIRGPNVMKGYYNAPEETAAVLSQDGWFNTHDLARFEGEYLYIVGRTKELIICSGFNVYPAEIEAVLNAHANVRQSAVIGRATQGDEEIIAFIEPVAGTVVSEATIAEHAAQYLASYKQPSRFFIVHDLPTTASGKVLKSALPALADALIAPKN